MSYDRVWIQCSENRAHLHERREAEAEGRLEEFNKQADRLYAQGHFVVLSAGKSFAFDEIVLFEDASDAGAFYESGYKDWESFLEDDTEGCGFQEVSLYWAGAQMVTKECAPTKRREVNREQLG